MMASISRHYQTITSIKFTDDGSHFVTAGHDGMLLVWKLSSVLSTSQASGQQATPLYSFSDHALPISDIHVSRGGMRAHLTSVSLDRTLKIYDLASGTLLLNLVFPEALTSVTVDHLDTKVYVGSADGNIFEFNLQSPPRMKEYHLSDVNVKNKFIGHKGAVTALSVSLDGESLLSGGNDENVLLWHITSKQLIRTLPHKGAITNAFFMLAPRCMFDQEVKLTLIANSFKRMMDNDATTDDSHVVEVLVSQPITDDDEELLGGRSVGCESTAEGTSNHAGGQELESLRAEVKRLKKINKDLFEHSIKSVFGKE